MKIPNPKGLLSIGKAFTLAHRPELLFGASIVSTVAAVISAARGGYEAHGIIHNENVQRMAEGLPLTTKKEEIKLTWLCYLPAAGLAGAAIGSTTGLHLVHVKEKKALAAAALMAIDEIKNEANDYKEKVLEIVNDDKKTHEEKSQEVEELTSRDFEPYSSEIMETDGLYPCYDDYANRAFRSNREHIRRAANVVIAEAMKTGKANLNLFYEELDMTPSQLGHQVGWTKEDVRGYSGKDAMEFVQFGMTELPDGSAATACWFREAPTSDYEARVRPV